MLTCCPHDGNDMEKQGSVAYTDMYKKLIVHAESSRVFSLVGGKPAAIGALAKLDS